ncbi:NADPH:quinone oxidoreductase family protein [Arundinibacter roseus]|uniref:NADPH:quinone oxidoreductase family protein n=1 Tax=Arundinibacter roseus TaxID=2070510 RepID=A0A4R4KKZ7_9BACT|nr:NADPH:quinone oxidoreductase family protein [Arundinibacter roseus]TDB68984.1 NADPH:quinone oxidoreductase family protein [Arundinibacter roseus]
MKAILCTHFGPPEELTLSEVPSPKPGKGQVTIAVKACGVNFPDTLLIQNKYQFKPPLPFSPGGEVAGIVLEVGENVAHVAVGQRVLALTGWGGFAEEVAADAATVLPIPPDMDFVAASSMMYTYGTSYHALKNRAQLQPGETLLVLGAAGGVGLAAVQLGVLMGARVIAAASSDEKLAICRTLGAAETINYSTEDLRERIKEYTAGRGVDVVYDPVGDRYTEPALRSIAWKGRYLVVGFAAGEIPKIPLNLALLKGCQIVGVFWGAFAKNEPKESQQNFKELLYWMTEGKLSQHIHKIYSLPDAPAALRDMMERRVVGKAVVEVFGTT